MRPQFDYGTAALEYIGFWQEHDAAEPLHLFNTYGLDSMLGHLAQRHHPGEHDIRPVLGVGTDDEILIKGGYIITLNVVLPYVSLSAVICPYCGSRYIIFVDDEPHLDDARFVMCCGNCHRNFDVM